MRTTAYKQIIGAYDTRHGAVRANLTYDMLCRIKIPVLGEKEQRDFVKNRQKIDEAAYKLREADKQMCDYISSIFS